MFRLFKQYRSFGFILCLIHLIGLSQMTSIAQSVPGTNPDLRLNANEPLLYYFGFIPQGSFSSSRTIRFATQDVTSSLSVSAPEGFELSKNNIDFASSIRYETSELRPDMTCYVRFKPLAVNQGYGGSILFSSSGIQVRRPDLSGSSLSDELSLDIVNWNLEWFGGSLGPVDDDRQMGLAAVVMDSLRADVYVLQEIVDTARLGTLTRSLKSGPYDYVVSPYASNALNTASGNWRVGQKLAFVYRKDLISFPSARAFTSMGSSANYYNWANGRYPFLLDAMVTIDGRTKRVIFLSVHAKAELGDTDDYTRRKGASTILYDSLNLLYPSQHVLVAGDFNDDLDQTISSVFPGFPTPYLDFMNDQTRYSALSFWNSVRGDNSYVGYPNMVDHCIVSNEMKSDYVDYSCVVRKDVTNWVPFYADDLSDHYPVQSRFYLRQSGINQVTAVSSTILPKCPFRAVYVNGKAVSLQFDRRLSGTLNFELRTMAGQLIWSQQRSGIDAGTMFELPCHKFPAGGYNLLLHTSKEVFTTTILF